MITLQNAAQKMTTTLLLILFLTVIAPHRGLAQQGQLDSMLYCSTELKSTADSEKTLKMQLAFDVDGSGELRIRSGEDVRTCQLQMINKKISTFRNMRAAIFYQRLDCENWDDQFESAVRQFLTLELSLINRNKVTVAIFEQSPDTTCQQVGMRDLALGDFLKRHSIYPRVREYNADRKLTSIQELLKARGTAKK